MTSTTKLTVPDCSDAELNQAFRQASFWYNTERLTGVELGEWVAVRADRLDALAEQVAYSRKLMRTCINDPARFIPRDVQRDMRRAMRRIEHVEAQS